jgi:hypothetical protein
MKKASVILFALVMLAASIPLFADGAPVAKWTNWSEGIIYPYYQVGSAAASNGVGPNWAGTGSYQSWALGYDGNNYGYSSIFEFGDAAFAVANLSWYQAYYKMFDMVKLTFGKPNIRDYRLTDKINGNGYNALFNWGDQHGLAVQVTPVAGLSVALGLYVPNVAAGTNLAALDYANNFGAAFSYAIPDMATIAVDYRGDLKQVSVGANITAVKDIGVVVSYQADFSNSAQLVSKAFVSASAAFAPVTVAADFAMKYATALNFAVEADVQYAMAPWTIGVTVGYDDGLAWVGSGMGLPGDGLSFFPYVAAGFDNGSSVKIGFVYAAGSGASPVATMGLPILYTFAW